MDKNIFEMDRIKTSAGEIKLSFIGHGSLMIEFSDAIIHIDPFSRVADYTQLPPADLIFITHEHLDHFDPEALEHIQKKETTIFLTERCSSKLEEGTVLNNGDIANIHGLQVEAVPAYNIKHLRENGEPYHPKGHGNGYVFTFGDKRVYIAGDTENIPEMAELKDIDIAFLPMNLPYTMTPEMVADAVSMLQPKIVYPYHYGNTDPELLAVLLEDMDVEVRIRRLA